MQLEAAAGEEREMLFDFVDDDAARGIHRMGVGEGTRLGHAAKGAEAIARAAEERVPGGAVALGKADGEVEAVLAQFADEAELVAEAGERASVAVVAPIDEDFVDVRVVGEHVFGAGIDDDGDAGLGKGLAQGAQNGRNHQHVADVAHFENRQAANVLQFHCRGETCIVTASIYEAMAYSPQ